ncbi:hypothetical protein A6A04_13755 [Paramagnetospirillum marisnigri]|uniref:CheW-like domain-containing protein n=1 Tax=Paramagnetospirillum marisnigri TaxID=1285242 RepID=A0A178MUJ3_9PROT|nr:hypothetical protein [Paramagnetospirillum marisnigri]OAN53950.1 hypothetical protein A6A04_13755 [Paramagnetospirillum marisnigri]
MTAEASLAVVTFVAAGTRFAMPSRQVAAMHPLDGIVSTTPSIEDLLGLPREAAAGCLLVLRLKQGEVAIQVPGEVGLRELAAETIHPLPPLVAACSRIAGLAALAVDPDGVILLVEPARLG